MISIDAKQDCLDFQEKLMPNGVLYTYKRAFDTCDEDDYVIEVSHNLFNVFMKSCLHFFIHLLGCHEMVFCYQNCSDLL